MSFVGFLLFVAAGFVLIIRTDDVLGFFGRVGWAERNIGPGGSISFYKLLGVVIILLAFMWITGIFERVFGGLFGALFGGFKG